MAGVTDATSTPPEPSFRAMLWASSSSFTNSFNQLTLIFMCRASLELAQEAQVVVVVHADVVDAVAQHPQTLHADAEGPARVALGVDLAGLEHVGMHHAAAQHLQPAGVLAHTATGAAAEHAADVHFRARLHEREVRWPKTQLEFVLLEEALHELCEGAAQMGHAHALIHQQPLHLVEHGRMGHVVVMAVSTSHGDDADGRTYFKHRADLHR